MQECINRHCFYMWILKCKLVFKFSVHLRENRRQMGKFFYIVHKQRLHRLQGELNAVWNQFNRFSVYNAVSHYDYTLLQKMLLKYAFNDLRSRKDDTYFFTQNILDFLMNKNIVDPLRNVTVLVGLAVNTSPAPDYMFGNNKIRWGKNPAFLSNSIIEHINYETGEIRHRSENPRQEFKKMSFSYIFRFNSGQFLLICWDDDISDDDLKTNNVILQCQYPYTILSSQGHHTLSRCTSETTYHFEMLIDVSWGQGIFDDVTWMRGTYTDKSQQDLKEIARRWQKEEEDLAKRFPR